MARSRIRVATAQVKRERIIVSARLHSIHPCKVLIPPGAVPTAGTYVVTLKCESEAFPESHRAHRVVGFRP